ncbi:hypothetical protein ILUMI_21849 [Ignelater luminosus]|uniref:Uncharacterized protein n=1 Tax=Ignelater luminosus TaxID=2038154 RepID=A0A8K0CBA6_IGNLU|nr:hypothetical protein ILUMI_21849 [Ignelater luminosus]
MPEISQDKFESKNPLLCSITPELLRARANSAGNKTTATVICQKIPEILQRLSSCVSENDLESYMEGLVTAESSWIDERELSHRVSRRSLKLVSHYPVASLISSKKLCVYLQQFRCLRGETIF